MEFTDDNMTGPWNVCSASLPVVVIIIIIIIIKMYLFKWHCHAERCRGTLHSQ